MTSEDGDPGRLRLFVAVDLSSGLKGEVLELRERLRPKVAGVRWVRSEGTHITLKFFGWVEKERVAAIEKVLRTEAETAGPMELALSGLGVFPQRGAPRVLWVGVRDEGRLLAFQERLELGFERIGFPREKRPFSPHLTLGRVAGRLAPGSIDAILEEKVSWGPFPVGEIDLMRSELKPGGSVYTKLLTVVLGKNQNS